MLNKKFNVNFQFGLFLRIKWQFPQPNICTNKGSQCENSTKNRSLTVQRFSPEALLGMHLGVKSLQSPFASHVTLEEPWIS